MWKYLLAAFFLIVGSFELLLAFHAPLRRALLETLPVRAPSAEPLVFLVIGSSAILTGLGIILYGMFW